MCRVSGTETSVLALRAADAARTRVPPDPGVARYSLAPPATRLQPLRGIVATGPYSIIRHPIYAGYLVAHVGFLIAHPTMWNVVILTLSDICLVIRTSLEERILSDDEGYRRYCQRVGWRLLPGVY